MIEELRRNIDSEIDVLREIAKYSNMLERASTQEKEMLDESIRSLKESMKIINNAIPEILNNVTITQKLKAYPVSQKLERLSVKKRAGEITVTLNKKDKERFIKELSLNEKLIKKIKIGGVKEEDKSEEFKAPRGYLKISNRFFLDIARGFVRSGKFKSLSTEIKKANFDMLVETYVAMILFTTFLSFFISVFLMIFFIFFNIGVVWPFITTYSGSYILRVLKLIWMPIIIPAATFMLTYIYPSTEKDSIAKRIDRELPFAVIHMSAISGSGITPAEIFKIIGMSKDYSNLGREMRKVLNQINLYGYDLVTALNNVSKATPSTKLAELFAGLTTTMSSGGSLQTFFEKRAETLLLDYRLEREKYTQVAETFMDIYITVVVAAPMILMLLLIMIVMTGIQISFSPSQITFILIGLIALINIIFLGVLQIKQPGY